MVVTEIARPRPGDQVIPSLPCGCGLGSQGKRNGGGGGGRGEAKASRTESGIYRRRDMGHGQVGPTSFWSAA